MLDKQLSFIFPGQGSQRIGMLQEVALYFPVIRGTFDEASSILGYSLWDVAQHGPSDKISDTKTAQLLLLISSVALWRLYCDLTKTRPCVLAGHGLGEYSALVCANAISFSDALKLISLRCDLIQDAYQPDEIATASIVGFVENKINYLCHKASHANTAIVEVSSINAAMNMQVAGHFLAVENILSLAQDNGASFAVMLDITVPLYTSLLKKVSEQFALELAKIPMQKPNIPIIQNYKAESYYSVKKIKASLVKQVYNPILWFNTVNCMSQQGITKMVECGEGRILQGIIKQIDKEIEVYNLSTSQALKHWYHHKMS